MDKHDKNHRLANINIDVDTLNEDLEKIPENQALLRKITYQKALPRLIGLLDKHNIKATFFIIGKDALANKDIIKKLSGKGHEIANHTMSHKKQFVNLAKKEKEYEISSAEKILEGITGKKVVGFRAPGGTMDSELISILRKRKYLYDASLNSSLLYYFAKIFYRLFLLENKGYITTQKLKICFSPAKPYHPHPKYFWRNYKHNKDFFEFPVSKSGITSLPFMSAVLLVIGRLPAKLAYLLSKSSKILTFNVHVVEFTDKKDLENISPKSGYNFILAKKYLKMPLKKRMAFFDEFFTAINKDYRLLTFGDMAKMLRKNEQRQRQDN